MSTLVTACVMYNLMRAWYRIAGKLVPGLPPDTMDVSALAAAKASSTSIQRILLPFKVWAAAATDILLDAQSTMLHPVCILGVLCCILGVSRCVQGPMSTGMSTTASLSMAL